MRLRNVGLIVVLSVLSLAATCGERPCCDPPDPRATPTQETPEPTPIDIAGIIHRVCPQMEEDQFRLALTMESCGRLTSVPLAQVCVRAACAKLAPTPTATPSPSPSSTATVVASATAAPTATSSLPTPPGPIPWVSKCSIPPSTTQGCGHPGGEYINIAMRASDNVFAKHPELFRFQGVQGCSWQVIPTKETCDAFWLYAMQEVVAMGYCANYDGENLGIKDPFPKATGGTPPPPNWKHEGYHLLNSWGGAPCGGCLADRNGVQKGSCKPADF